VKDKKRKELRDIYLKAAERLASLPEPLFNSGCCAMIYCAIGDTNDLFYEATTFLNRCLCPAIRTQTYWMILPEDGEAPLCYLAPRQLIERRIIALLLMAEIVMTEDLKEYFFE
jgi:hypothetical protein